MPRALKAVPFIRYVWAKSREDDLWQGYLADCEWSQATDMRFKESDAPKEKSQYTEKATLPRWLEVRYPNHEMFTSKLQDKLTKDDIKERLSQLRGR